MAVYLLGFREPDLSLRLGWVNLDLHDDLCEDVPAWWLLKKKKTMYYTGGADARSVRSLMQFMMSPLNPPSVFHKAEADFADIRAYLLRLQPPKYPLPIDKDIAEQGAVLFKDNCARCHGTYGEKWTYPNKIVPLKDIGTDRRRYDGITAKFGTYYNKSWFAQGKSTPTPDGLAALASEGYQAPPLDGIWATAPYLHNGSVPTVYNVLNSKTGPSCSPAPIAPTWRLTMPKNWAGKWLCSRNARQAAPNRSPQDLRHHQTRPRQRRPYLWRSPERRGTPGGDRVSENAVSVWLGQLAALLPGRGIVLVVIATAFARPVIVVFVNFAATLAARPFLLDLLNFVSFLRLLDFFRLLGLLDFFRFLRVLCFLHFLRFFCFLNLFRLGLFRLLDLFRFVRLLDLFRFVRLLHFRLLDFFRFVRLLGLFRFLDFLRFLRFLGLLDFFRLVGLFRDFGVVGFLGDFRLLGLVRDLGVIDQSDLVGDCQR